jgi:hypothetical protein
VPTSSDADQVYNGSRFSEVRDAIFANPYQKVWGGPNEPPLPVEKVTAFTALKGILHPSRFPFLLASKDRIDSAADLFWGSDRKGRRRILHPNGVVLTGVWEITEETNYSGYFSTGSRGLIVGRYSACCSEPWRGYLRSLGHVGKIFPTMDPEHAEPLKPANFITQQDLGGDYSDYINDAATFSAPNTTAFRRKFSDVVVLLVSGVLFLIADRHVSLRQLYQIAELGKPPGQPTRSPTYIRFLPAPEQPRIEGEKLDVRDEVMAQIYNRGDPEPKRTLTFTIEVTDDGVTRGLPVYERRTFQNWRRIGRIVYDRAAPTHNGDYVLQFQHPTWRSDQNDPSTDTRVNGKKVSWGL